MFEGGLGASYLRYNHALNEIFFSGRFDNQPVYLSLDADHRVELASSLGESADDIETRICQATGKVFAKGGDPYEYIVEQANRWWYKSRHVPPPFTAVLFTLSHAASLMAAEDDLGSNNYYVRLSEITRCERTTLSAHGRTTDRLWELLELWLAENNFELGRPTAVSINAWKYVGKALSQVVVRAGDREQFHDMFTRYGFTGHETISPEGIWHYLSNWMLSSRPSQRLKAVWRKSELQLRVCESAVAELAHWASASAQPAKGTSASTPKRSIPLSLIASFVTRFPRPTKLELQIGRCEERGEPLQPLCIDGSSEQQFALANDDFGTFATISPSPIGADSRTISRSYNFVAPGDLHLDWQPRMVIPLAKANDGPYWIEVARVTFGQPHLILVRNIAGFPKKVEAHLSQAALEMPSKVTPLDLPGLPSDWVLYTDARLGQPTSTPSPDLQALVPIGDGGVLAVEGSFQLARGIFHSNSELVANVMAPLGPTELLAFPLGPASGEAIWRACDAGNTCRLTIVAQETKGHSGFRLEGRTGKNNVASAEILLRNADTPRALDRQGRDALRYHNPISAAGLSKRIGQPYNVSVVGMVVAGIDNENDNSVAFSLESRVPRGETEETQDAVLVSSILKHSANQTCAERGYHFWQCETRKPDRPKKTPLRQECKDCAQAIIVIGRGEKTAQAMPVGLRPMKSFAGVDAPSLPRIDHDLLFDALCFHGTGSWGKFEALLADKINMPWQAREIAENYSLLGLLDLELRPGTNIVQRWSVPACAANFIDEDTAFLSGFRSHSMLMAISTAVDDAGGHIMRTSRTSVPTQIEVKNLESARLLDVLAKITDPLGRLVNVTESSGSKIAKACLKWGNFDACLVPISVGRQANLQLFNLKTARWESVNSICASGAYRWNDGRQTYAFVDEFGNSFAGQHQVIKLMAARSQQHQLHAYDGKMQVLLASLGCAPPGLFGRALVACSGRLPEISDGLLKYSKVDSQTARLILHAMYRKEVRDETRYANQRH